MSRHTLHRKFKPVPGAAWQALTRWLFRITAGITTVAAILITTACKPEKQTAPGAAGNAGDIPLLPAASGGQRKILATLEEMGKGTNREDSFFGAGKIPELRASLERIPPDEVSQLKPRILYALGREELRMNNLEEGIAHLKEALKLAPEVTFQSSTLRDVWINRVRFNIGVGYLRLGETENCCQRYTAESCIV
ncbi:MAG: tetratricopeptide repeat protein, partial [Verrucomicrobiales bacterium]